MLYCPKCQASYTDGTQRFCTNEGARLLPFPSADSSAATADKGVFTSILKKTLLTKDDSASKQVNEKSEAAEESFEPPEKSTFFKSGEREVSGETIKATVADRDEILETAQEASFKPLPIARIIDPSSIPETQTDSKTPTARVKKEAASVGAILENDSGTSDFENLLDLSGDYEPGLPSSEVSEESYEFSLDLDDPLDTGELFDMRSEVADGRKSEDDLLALPSFESEGSAALEAQTSQEIELDLESPEQVNLSASIPAIELELADITESVISETDFTSQVTTEDLADVVANEEGQNLESATNSVIVKPIDTTPSVIKASDESAWEKRSSEPAANEESRWFLYPLIAIVVLGLGLVSFFFLTRKDSSSYQNANDTANLAVPEQNVNSNANTSLESGEELIPPVGNPGEFQDQPHSALLDVPPPSRRVKQPPNTRIYKNERNTFKGVLAEKFLGFSIYYPKDWVLTNADNKFLDIAKKAPDGLPIKQLLITRYDSNGTYEADIALFDGLVETSNADLRKILANYQVISKGEATFQDGRWRTYEVKFQGVGGDKKLIIWGRRLWIPVQRPGMTSGFIITMIGTSLSKDVKSVEDLGVSDDLAEILKTFEPDLK